eukprot:scaffold183906_cov25-Tisochrysis_lutea.AAC.3
MVRTPSNLDDDAREPTEADSTKGSPMGEHAELYRALTSPRLESACARLSASLGAARSRESGIVGSWESGKVGGGRTELSTRAASNVVSNAAANRPRWSDPNRWRSVATSSVRLALADRSSASALLSHAHCAFSESNPSRIASALSASASIRRTAAPNSRVKPFISDLA